MKHSFLGLVAQNLYDNYGEKLSEFVMIFPNKRAGKFFNEHLYEVFQRSFKAPECCTISDLVRQASDAVLADELELIYLLYKVFIKHAFPETPKNIIEIEEPFEKFYSWGQTLLSDFDDVDKNLVDPQKLFRNIDEYKSIDRLFDFLSDEQRQFLDRFFNGVKNSNPSDLQRRFISVWNILFSVYKEFNQELSHRKKAYEGILYRNAVDQLQNGNYKAFPNEKYVFIGFNVLNKAEEILFTSLKQNNQAVFYWDYDLHYIENEYQEAGIFMKENLKKFPSPLNDSRLFDNLRKNNRQARIISTSGKTIQARYLSEVLTDINKTYPNAQQCDVAVVLCDENILQPVLHGLPTTFGNEETKVNITMGYPFQETALCSLIETWKTYHLNGIRNGKCRLKFLEPLLLNPYWQAVFPKSEQWVRELKKQNNHYPFWENLPDDIRPLLQECKSGKELLNRLSELISAIAGSTQQNPEVLFRTYKTIQRLKDFIENEVPDLSTTLAARTIDSVLRSVIVPLQGDPIEGLQIMGILETRSLDFDHVVLLSVNEGVLPKKHIDSSFIPFSFRRAYDLTTSERKTAVFAYYFLRLLQRCQSVTFIYDSSSSEMGAGEMSRFLQQLRIETDWNISYKNLFSPLELPDKPLFYPKHDDLVLQHLREYTVDDENKKRTLSPSGLNAYIDCPLRFYLKYILGINAEKETSEDLTALDFGTAFHCAAELLYREITNQPLGTEWNHKKTHPITKDNLEPYLPLKSTEKQPSEKVLNLMKQALNYTYFHKNDLEYLNAPLSLNTRQKLSMHVLSEYLTRLVKKDFNYAPFDLIAPEYPISGIFPLSGTSQPSVRLGGIVDRIDLKNGVLRIVDYKTGGTTKKISDLDSLFESSYRRHAYGFQILFYAWLIHRNKQLIHCNFQSVNTSILYMNRLSETMGEDAMEMKEESYDVFENNMQDCLSELFSFKQDFLRCGDEQLCTYCDYIGICLS